MTTHAVMECFTTYGKGRGGRGVDKSKDLESNVPAMA